MQEMDIPRLVGALTLEEKVSMLAGANFWATPPVARLGIPPLKVSDGPNGARGSGGLMGGGITSACFPAGISLASTWNTVLVERIGGALAEEVRSKNARVLLAPTVNIHRTPLNGRNFECYSEDPYLTTRLAVAYVNGLQRAGVGATIKHFVCNDSEYQRNSISSDVDERTLREIYLPPFEAAVKEAGVWAVMSSYNRVNGTYASESRALLCDILKDEWGFDGVVMSDWGGTYSTADALNHGLDLEMPGPPSKRGAKLLKAVADGQVAVAALDNAVARILRLMARTGAHANDDTLPEQALNNPAHRALIRAAGAEGVVLLKNNGVLPLNADRLNTVAMVGPNAGKAQMMGGGSAFVNAHYTVTPVEGFAAHAGERVELAVEEGCANYKMLPLLSMNTLTRATDGGHGFDVEYFDSPELSGTPVRQEHSDLAEKLWMTDFAMPGQPGRVFSTRNSAVFTPQESGMHTFSLTSVGKSRLFVNERLVVDNWDNQSPGESYFGFGSAEVRAQLALTAGVPYTLQIDYARLPATPLPALRMGHVPPPNPAAMDRAVALASGADVAVVYIGTNGEWETEGYDRAGLALPGEQDLLVERVAAANPRTVVVVQTGGPVQMPWLDKVAAVVQGWFPGQECGNAITDVLFGVVNPSGKLPETFPMRVEDNPGFINYPGENGHVRYGEGIYVGYRYYEKKFLAPLFPFGFGMSYTSYELRQPSAEHRQACRGRRAHGEHRHHQQRRARRAGSGATLCAR